MNDLIQLLKDIRPNHGDVGSRDVDITATREKITEAITLLEAMSPEKMAPVQGYPRGIPWSMHLDAYDVYCKKYSPQKALIVGGCRGGFGCEELDMFIPGWREKLSEMGKLKARVAELEAQVADKEADRITRTAFVDQRREKEATQLANIHIHIADYHYALDTRQHGGDAARTAFAAICGELDVYWKQGEEAQRRKVKA